MMAENGHRDAWHVVSAQELCVLTEHTASISTGAGDCGQWAQDHPARNDISQPPLQLAGPCDQVLADGSSSQACKFWQGQRALGMTPAVDARAGQGPGFNPSEGGRALDPDRNKEG